VACAMVKSFYILLALTTKAVFLYDDVVISKSFHNRGNGYCTIVVTLLTQWAHFG
jgi:hypothetical protein